MWSVLFIGSSCVHHVFRRGLSLVLLRAQSLQVYERCHLDLGKGGKAGPDTATGGRKASGQTPHGKKVSERKGEGMARGNCTKKDRFGVMEHDEPHRSERRYTKNGEVLRGIGTAPPATFPPQMGERSVQVPAKMLP